MDIYTTNLSDAIKTGAFDPKKHVISEKGEIKKLSKLSLWSIGFFTQKTSVNSEILAKSIEDQPTETVKNNLSELRNLGYLTTLEKQQIERSIDEAAKKAIKKA